MQVSRRDLLLGAAASAAAGPVLAAAADRSIYRGVRLGVQTYSFHEIPDDGTNHVDKLIADMRACGAYACELFAQQVAPGVLTGARPPLADCPDPLHGCAPGKGGTLRNPWRWVFASYAGAELAQVRARQKAWDETVSMDFFRSLRRRINAAGIVVTAYNVMLPPDASDLELDRFFQAARTLGASSLNVSTRYDYVKRLAPFAETHRVAVGVHGHGVTWDDQEISQEASFERIFAISPWVKANLDIGHFTAGGGDPVAFIDKHHDRICNLHLKDRKRNTPGKLVEEDGASVPWGQGDTPIREVLLLLQKRRYDIPAYIEYEHAGSADPVTEVKKALDTCKAWLAAGRA